MLVAVLGLVAAGCIPQGTHTVSSFGEGGVSPGLWRSLGGQPCEWARLGPGGRVIASSGDPGPQYVQIEATDAGFRQQGCLPFWQEPGPFAKPLVRRLDSYTPPPDFGEGDYLLDYEIAGAIWSAPGGPSCSWEKLRGFHGTPADVVASGTGDDPAAPEGDRSNPGVQVSLYKADSTVGFSSKGCGTWTAIGGYAIA